MKCSLEMLVEKSDAPTANQPMLWPARKYSLVVLLTAGMVDPDSEDDQEVGDDDEVIQHWGSSQLYMTGGGRGKGRLRFCQAGHASNLRDLHSGERAFRNQITEKDDIVRGTLKGSGFKMPRKTAVMDKV